MIPEDRDGLNLDRTYEPTNERRKPKKNDLGMQLLKLIGVAFVTIMIVFLIIIITGAEFRDNPPTSYGGSAVCDSTLRLSGTFSISEPDDAVTLGRRLCRRLLCPDGVSCCSSVSSFDQNLTLVNDDVPELTQNDCYHLIQPVYCNNFAMNAAAYESASDSNIPTWFADFLTRAPQMRSACEPFCVNSLYDIKECSERTGKSVTDLLSDDPSLASEVSALTSTFLSPVVFVNGDNVRLLHSTQCDTSGQNCTSVAQQVEHLRTGQRTALSEPRTVDFASTPPSGLTCELKELSGLPGEAIDLSTKCDPSLFGTFTNINSPSFDSLGRPMFSTPIPPNVSERLQSGMSAFWQSCSADCSAQ